MSGPKLGPSPTYLGFTRDRTPKLRLASLAPQGDGLRLSAASRWMPTAERGNIRAVRQGAKKKPRAEAGRDLKRLCEPPASPEAAPDSAAHVSGAMTRLSQAPVFVLTAPYASAPRIAMAVGTAAPERGYRFNRRQGGGRHCNAEQHQPERLYEVHGYVFPIKARFRAIALIRFLATRIKLNGSRVFPCRNLQATGSSPCRDQ